MSDYKVYELAEICSRLSSGKGIPASRISIEGDFPVYGGNGLRGYTDQANFSGECAIIGRQGAFCGNVRYFKGEAYMTEHAVVVCATPEHNTRYLSYLLSTMNLGRLSGQSAQPGLSVKTLAKQEVKMPSLEIQDRVASILALLDEKIELNKTVNENLQQQARAVFQAWFIDYEPFGGAAPLAWHPSTLGQIAELKTDSWSPAKNPDVMVEHYSIPAFDEQHYPVFEIATGIKSNKYILNSNSVMISKLNPDTKRIWRPLCLSAHSVCSTEFIVYEAKKQEQRDYIYSILDSTPFLNHLCSHTTGSTNSRQRATPKSTLDFTLCLPPDSIIEDFCQIVTPMYDLIASNIVENQSLAKTRDSLLPRLMSGELDVSGIQI